MTRISRRVRAEAIELLLIDADGDGADELYGDEVDADVRHTAAAARLAVWDITGFSLQIADDLLEAAALLRDGWCPGDPVRLLRGES